MPANYDRDVLKSQIAAAAADLRALVEESAFWAPGLPFIPTRELFAAFTALDEVEAHAGNQISRNWPEPE